MAGATDSSAAAQSLQRLRRELLPQTTGTVPDTEWAATGRTASDADFRERMAAALPPVVAPGGGTRGALSAGVDRRQVGQPTR
ncbi:hypothetical protein AB0B85_24520 [Micromonospora sp. NPDC049044]|uniref:hypothetical protein n=1 Tax=unclassified Micromonospora TaxID=2617518 RepID=UPI0033FF9D23